MRTIDDYLTQAAEFDRMADRTAQPTLKSRYAELAASYRALAAERQRLIAEGTIEPETKPRAAAED
jgi:hypothetical protein